MLAKNVNDYVGCLAPRGVLAFFASVLAPTGKSATKTKPLPAYADRGFGI
jgi:hypothetical protein